MLRKLVASGAVCSDLGLYMHSIAWWPTLIALMIATVCDIRTRRVPNWLVFPFLLSGVGMSLSVHGWSGLGSSLAAAVLAGILMGIFHWLGGMGMGDVKLCAAIGAWIGPSQLLMALVVMGIAGGVMAFAWAAFGGFLKEAFNGTGDLVFGFKKRGFRPDPALVLSNPASRKMPYVPAIAIGTIFSFFTLT